MAHIESSFDEVLYLAVLFIFSLSCLPLKRTKKSLGGRGKLRQDQNDIEDRRFWIERAEDGQEQTGHLLQRL